MSGQGTVSPYLMGRRCSSRVPASWFRPALFGARRACAGTGERHAHTFAIIVPGVGGRHEHAALLRAIARMDPAGGRVVAVETSLDRSGLRVDVVLADRGRRAVREAHRVVDLLLYDALGLRGVETIGAFVAEM